MNNSWSVQLQEIDRPTVLIIVKKHDMMMLVTSIQTACSKCSMAAFCSPGVFLLILALRQASADRQHTVLQFRKCRSVLVCSNDTTWASHPICQSSGIRHYEFRGHSAFQMISIIFCSHFRYSSCSNNELSVVKSHFSDSCNFCFGLSMWMKFS